MKGQQCEKCASVSRQTKYVWRCKELVAPFHVFAWCSSDNKLLGCDHARGWLPFMSETTSLPKWM